MMLNLRAAVIAGLSKRKLIFQVPMVRIHSAPAGSPVRTWFFEPDPVPAELIRKILEAGTAAPSGGNMQRWRFLVALVPISSRRSEPITSGPGRRLFVPVTARETLLPGRAQSASGECSTRRSISPILSMKPRLDRAMPGGCKPVPYGRLSIYPAVQNMLLATRALGLGATLTTLYLTFETEVESILSLPADVHSYALLPIGYPIGRFGPVRRVPLAEVVYRDRDHSAATGGQRIRRAGRTILPHCQRRGPASRGSQPVECA
jgi:nitroreductase